MKKQDMTIKKILEEIELIEGPQVFEGYKLPDKNLDGNFILVENKETFYSFNSADLLREDPMSNGKVRILMRLGCSGIISKPFKITSDRVTLLSVNESSPLPKATVMNGDPRMATQEDVDVVRKTRPLAKTLPSVAANWSNSCGLGDSESNNCAHFLSNAFILAGFNELKKSSSNSNFNEWCDYNDAKKNPEARPIRAKEMWAWFQKMAKNTQRTKPSKKGYWAVFQWDASYSGGHVLLYDSDNGIVYGTGAYWTWTDQFFYQW